jgi:peptide-methionine (R)-S-oxide reductase
MPMKTDKDWKNILEPEVYRILREKGTERAFTGLFDRHFEAGMYVCAGCEETLFHSDSKFDSHCGWPAFDEANEGKVKEEKDTTFGMIRVEILCAKCDGHLGHVFTDGPTKTGLRYCVNSLALKFKNKP